VIALVVVIFIVIATKAISGRGTPLRGGLPSGHAAVAFAAWIATTYVLSAGEHRFLVSTLTFIMALLVAQKALNIDAIDDADERTGAKIVYRALEEPLRQISENAGLEGSVVVNDVRKAEAGQGLNAATGAMVDLVAEGIIDPAMVTRSALQNAASIAKNILTTEAIVAEIPEKETAGAGGGMPDMGGMM